MSSAAGLHNIFLQTPAPSFDHLRQQRRISEDETNLLYKTYQDYFTMEEDITSTVNDEASSPLDSRTLGLVPPIAPPQHQLPKDETTKPSMNIGTFFFVLSASSPLTPETIFTSISPEIAEDIPESLSQLLPQPSTSLLEVIKETDSRVTLEPENLDDQGPSIVVPRPRSSSRLRRKSSYIHLRGNTASNLISERIIEQPNPPTSSVAEVVPVLPSPSLGPQSLRPLHPVPIEDLYTRIKYSSQNSTPIGHRPRGAQSMDLSRRQPVPPCGHTRGLSSPFPLPIQFTFAPPSVTGSTATPYSYF